jgi:hypothetical protein
MIRALNLHKQFSAAKRKALLSNLRNRGVREQLLQKYDDQAPAALIE